MEVPVNYLAVLAAAVAAMGVGFVWYGPLFGKPWMKMMGWGDKKMEGMGKAYGVMMVSSLVMAYVLAHALEFASVYLGVDGVAAGVMTGWWNWLGFVAPVTLGSVLWEGKPWKLWLLNNGYWLVTLVAMGTILAVWS